MEPRLPGSSPALGFHGAERRVKGAVSGSTAETQGELGSLADPERAAPLDPMTACELPEKMARGRKAGREPQMPGGPCFGGTASLGPGSSRKSLH